MMTPLQKIRWLILEKLRKRGLELPEITAANIDALWDRCCTEREDLYDAQNEVRCSGENTGIKARSWDRHYECDEVAAKCPDGTWIGWTYWHGGGKHGEPAEVEWMEYAYDVTLTEEQKMVTVRTFAAVPKEPVSAITEPQATVSAALPVAADGRG